MDRTYGQGNWRVIWKYSNGRIVSFDEIFEEVYVEVVEWVINQASYVYDRDLVTRVEAFQPRLLV
ncbi:MAG: hypothetical protein ACOX6N_05230 [Patescibacteria group bacterium]|jgi:hypothetical protein